jgi:hypothetical protein
MWWTVPAPGSELPYDDHCDRKLAKLIPDNKPKSAVIDAQKGRLLARQQSQRSINPIPSRTSSTESEHKADIAEARSK